MLSPDIPFSETTWSAVEPTSHAGAAGLALWRTMQFGDTRVRLVEYSPGYEADHWCSRGHVLLVLEGTLRTELDDGREVVLSAGDSYHVSSGMEAHRSSTATGARLFIVD